MPKNALEWPIGEQVVKAWLDTKQSAPVWTETPPTLADNLPAYQAQQVGGSDRPDGLTKVLQVEVNTFAASRGDVWAATRNLQTLMHQLGGNAAAGWCIDEVTETFAPAIEPYENGDVRKATATYGIAVRPAITTL